MTLRTNIINNHPVIEDTNNLGVPVTNIYDNVYPDLVASNAALISNAGLALTHTGDPTVNDDVTGTAGNGSFQVPAIWTNSSDGKIFVCTDNTATAAVWTDIGQKSAIVIGTPDATEDITDELQTAITNRDVNGLPILITGGRKYINKTIFTGANTSGGRIMGSGPGGFVSPTNPQFAGTTLLEWTGSVGTGEPMFDCRGTHMHFSDFRMAGGVYNETDYSNKCDIGFLMNKRIAGIGTGKLHFDNVSWAQFKTGFQASLDQSDTNCDLCSFVHTSSHHCHTDFRFEQAFSVAFTFNHHFSASVGLVGPYLHRIFDFRGGGNLQVYGVNPVGSGTMLYISSTDGEVGSNNGTFLIDGFKLDDQGSEFGRLLDMDTEQIVDFKFSNGHFAFDNYQPNGGYIANVIGPCRLHLDNVYNLQPETIKFNRKASGGFGGRPNIKIEDCRMDNTHGLTGVEDILDFASSSGDCYFLSRDCYLNPAIAPLPDVSLNLITGANPPIA